MQIDRNFVATSGRYLALGFQIGGSIVGGLVLGYYADAHLGTAPFLTLLLTLGGLFGAVRLLLWSLKKPNRDRIS